MHIEDWGALEGERVKYRPADAGCGYPDAALHQPAELDGARDQERKRVAEAGGRCDGCRKQARSEDADLLHDGRIRPRQCNVEAERRRRDAGAPRAGQARQCPEQDDEGLDPSRSDQGHLEAPVSPTTGLVGRSRYETTTTPLIIGWIVQ